MVDPVTTPAVRSLFIVATAAAILTAAPAAVGQETEWAVGADGTPINTGRGIAVDAAGNSYVIGEFRGTVTFGSSTITSAGSDDVLVAKVDALGNFQWGVSGGGVAYDSGLAIDVDAAGYSYVTGIYEGTATFGPTTLTSAGFGDAFVAKLDTDGVFQWAVSAGGATFHDHGLGIVVDQAGNSYVTGRYEGTATFGSITLTSMGSNDMFVAKLDAAGAFQWAVSGGGKSSDAGDDIAVDAGGNMYVTGAYQDSATFGSITLSSAGRVNVFVAKLDAFGIFQWAVSGGGESGAYGNGISIDATGSVYVTGGYGGNATFGSTRLTSVGLGDIFVAKLDGAGTYQWAVSAGGESFDGGQGTVDATGNVYLAGCYRFAATFGSISLASAGGDDVFVAKLDTNGVFEWAVSGGGPGGDRSGGIAVDTVGSSHVTGFYGDTATFGPITLTGAGPDVFVWKVNDTSSSCTADFDGDGVVGFLDLLEVLSNWGPCPGCPEDLDGDGVVGFTDLLAVLSNWGPC